MRKSHHKPHATLAPGLPHGSQDTDSFSPRMAIILDSSQRLRFSVRACLLFFFILSESLALSLPPQSQQIRTSSEDPSSPFNLSSSLLPPFDLAAASGPCSSVSGASTLTVGDVHCEGRDVSVYELLVAPNSSSNAVVEEDHRSWNTGDVSLPLSVPQLSLRSNTNPEMLCSSAPIFIAQVV